MGCWSFNCLCKCWSRMSCVPSCVSFFWSVLRLLSTNVLVDFWARFLLDFAPLSEQDVLLDTEGALRESPSSESSWIFTEISGVSSLSTLPVSASDWAVSVDKVSIPKSRGSVPAETHPPPPPTKVHDIHASISCSVDQSQIWGYLYSRYYNSVLNLTNNKFTITKQISIKAYVVQVD